MVDFSPKVSVLLKKLAFWDLAIARRKVLTHNEQVAHNGGRIQKPPSSRLWRRKKKAANIKVSLAAMSIEDMCDQRRKVKKRYVAAKKEHRSLRLDFLDTLSPRDRDHLKRTEQQPWSVRKSSHW